jgi:hypothetical protein
LEAGGAMLLWEGAMEEAVRNEELAVREAEGVCSCIHDEDGLGVTVEVGVA